MAPRGHQWFGTAQLLQGERIIRSDMARLHTASSPYWWEGDLILTTDRLMFLPYVDNPLLPNGAFWVSHIDALTPAGRNGLRVHSDDGSATFDLLGGVFDWVGLTGRRARPWIDDFDALRQAPDFGSARDGSPPRLAAG